MMTRVVLPDDLVVELRRAAEEQGVTLDELVQEAATRYLQLDRLHRLARYGRERALDQGVPEEDLPRLMKEWSR